MNQAGVALGQQAGCWRLCSHATQWISDASYRPAAPSRPTQPLPATHPLSPPASPPQAACPPAAAGCRLPPPPQPPCLAPEAHPRGPEGWGPPGGWAGGSPGGGRWAAPCWLPPLAPRPGSQLPAAPRLHHRPLPCVGGRPPGAGCGGEGASGRGGAVRGRVQAEKRVWGCKCGGRFGGVACTLACDSEAEPPAARWGAKPSNQPGQHNQKTSQASSAMLTPLPPPQPRWSGAGEPATPLAA